MGDIVAFPQVRAKDGGRGRIERRRRRLGLSEPFTVDDQSLIMDHADPVIEVADSFKFNPAPCDCA